jgi:transposase
VEQVYESDLTDEQWERIQELVQFGTGRKPVIKRRRILNAIFYVAHTGCQWRQLPHEFPNWSTVYSCYHRWGWNGVLDQVHAAMREAAREAVGKQAAPTTGSVDSQSVKTVAKGGSPAYCSAASIRPR